MVAVSYETGPWHSRHEPEMRWRVFRFSVTPRDERARCRNYMPPRRLSPRPGFPKVPFAESFAHQGEILARQMENRPAGNRLLCQGDRERRRSPLQSNKLPNAEAVEKETHLVEEGDRQAPGNRRGLMQLHLSTWPEIEGLSGPFQGHPDSHRLDRTAWSERGLLGTDGPVPGDHCPARRRRSGHPDRPDLQCRTGSTSHGLSRHHQPCGPSTMIASMLDWTESLARHGFERILLVERPWRQHRHDQWRLSRKFIMAWTFAGRRCRSIQYQEWAHRSVVICANWWELSGVMDLCREIFPVGEGSHATPQ